MDKEPAKTALIDADGILVLCSTCDQVVDLWKLSWIRCPLCGAEPDGDGNFLHEGPRKATIN